MTRADWSAVVLAAVPFDGSIPLGCWQLSRVLGRRRPLLYVEPPHSVAHGLPLRPSLRPAGDGSLIHILTPTVPPAPDRPFSGSVADIVIAQQLRAAADRCLEGKRVMVVCTPRRGLLRVPADVVLYWQRDAVRLLSRSARTQWVERRHLRLLREADVITAVSPELVSRSAAAGYEAVLVPNGCDYEHFSKPQPRPVGLPSDRLVFGFGGGVGERLDLDLLMSLVDARPEWLFVTVGEVVRTLPERENLLVAGRRPYSEMPAWLQHFDVGIIPYVEETSNLHSHPLKALEYLASGTPVVSVPINGLRSLSSAVYLASGPTDFLAALDALSLHRPSADECRLVAREHSWQSRVDVLERLVEDKLAASLSPR